MPATPNLPYSVKRTFDLNGKTYPDEKAVLLAAIEGLIGNPGFALIVLNNACALAPLLVRACEIAPPLPEPEKSSTE